jgi:hypothetical protein
LFPSSLSSLAFPLATSLALADAFEGSPRRLVVVSCVAAEEEEEDVDEDDPAPAEVERRTEAATLRSRPITIGAGSDVRAETAAIGVSSESEDDDAVVPPPPPPAAASESASSS